MKGICGLIAYVLCSVYVVEGDTNSERPGGPLRSHDNAMNMVRYHVYHVALLLYCWYVYVSFVPVVMLSVL